MPHRHRHTPGTREVLDALLEILKELRAIRQAQEELLARAQMMDRSAIRGATSR